MTAKAAVAISDIQVVGNGAEKVIRQIFVPAKNTPPHFNTGGIFLGNIVEGGKIIDEVIVGCQGPDNFNINCHGNPLIVEMIMKLLQNAGVKLVDSDQILQYLAQKKYTGDTIAAEVEIATVKATTLLGAKIIRHQTKMGLKQTAQWWLDNIETLQIDDIHIGIEQIQKDSYVAKLIIDGAKIVLAGPPNSGKSTLFNRLCGREKALVTDIAGTTRDWISAKLKLKDLSIELTDTAGLDERLSMTNKIDAESQKRATQLLTDADLVLMVLGSNKIVESNSLKDKNILVVLNKSDLPTAVKETEFANSIKISAKLDRGIGELTKKIRSQLGVADFDIQKTVCFTPRQNELIGRIRQSDSKKQIAEIIGRLLKGPICV